MGPPAARNRMFVWVMPAALLGLVAAVVVAPKLTTGPSRPPTPVAKTRSLDARYHRSVYNNDDLYDSAYETCEGLGIRRLARNLGVPASPVSRLAKAFAAENYASALRDGTYHACLDALLTELREEHRRG
jgi:hypothetical protein